MLAIRCFAQHLCTRTLGTISAKCFSSTAALDMPTSSCVATACRFSDDTCGGGVHAVRVYVCVRVPSSLVGERDSLYLDLPCATLEGLYPSQ